MASSPTPCSDGCACPPGSSSPVCQKACAASYYRAGLSCLACSAAACRAGSYRTPCGAAADSQCAPCDSLALASKPGATDYAACAGTYALDASRTVNGRPLYVNAAQARFLAYSAAGSWAISGTQWLDGIVAAGGAFGGFHSNGGPDLWQGWGSYTVTYPLQAAPACAAAWTCPAGRFLSGLACAPCSAPTCPVGTYATACSARADSACEPCTGPPPHSVFTGPGLPGAPASCGTACAPGYYYPSGGGACAACQITFTVKPGATDYAVCAGTYALDASRAVNGRPLYVNAAQARFLAYSAAGSWVMSGTQWLDGIVAAGGAFGGFHSNGGPDVMAGWGPQGYSAAGPPGCSGG